MKPDVGVVSADVALSARFDAQEVEPQVEKPKQNGSMQAMDAGAGCCIFFGGGSVPRFGFAEREVGEKPRNYLLLVFLLGGLAKLMENPYVGWVVRWLVDCLD